MRRIICLLAAVLTTAGVFAMDWQPVNAASATPGRTEIRNVSLSSRNEGTVTVRWSRTTCDGYQLQYADNDQFNSSISTMIKGGGTVSRTVFNLENDKVYYFRIRTYIDGAPDKVYGDWSGARSKKIEKKVYKQRTASAAAKTSKSPSTATSATKQVGEANAVSDEGGTANERARKAAVEWAVAIAGDNSFHYGKSKWAHHSGCYFCGTNTSKGSAKLKAGASNSAAAKTYCCNPFVTAAYHHGAGTKELDCRYKNKRVGLAGDSNKALRNKKNFKRISKPKKITSLQIGDILLTPTHCMLYAGGGKVVHAAHHDNGVQDSYWDDSITCEQISSKQWNRTSKIYRYLGTGKY